MQLLGAFYLFIKEVLRGLLKSKFFSFNLSLHTLYHKVKFPLKIIYMYSLSSYHLVLGSMPLLSVSHGIVKKMTEQINPFKD